MIWKLIDVSNVYLIRSVQGSAINNLKNVLSVLRIGTAQAIPFSYVINRVSIVESANVKIVQIRNCPTVILK